MLKQPAKDGTTLSGELLATATTYSTVAAKAYGSVEQPTFLRQLDEHIMKTNMKLVTEYLGR